MLNKLSKLVVVVIVGIFFVASSSFAVVKPASNTDLDSLSYVFYLFYDNGQLFADRDYDIKYDVIEQPFSQGAVTTSRPYKVEIVNFKFEVAGSYEFDPQNGNSGFVTGKIQARAPYVSDGQWAYFYNNQGEQVTNIFLGPAALCDDNNLCNSAGGENETTCPNDCKIQRTPVPVVTDIPVDDGGLLGGFDLNLILIYVVGITGIGVGAWLFIKWRRKKKSENFPMPPPSSSPPSPPVPPQPSSPSAPDNSSTGGVPSMDEEPKSTFPSGPQKPFPG